MENERIISFVDSLGKVSEKHLKFEFDIEEGVQNTLGCFHYIKIWFARLNLILLKIYAS